MKPCIFDPSSLNNLSVVDFSAIISNLTLIPCEKLQVTHLDHGSTKIFSKSKHIFTIKLHKFVTFTTISPKKLLIGMKKTLIVFKSTIIVSVNSSGVESNDARLVSPPFLGHDFIKVARKKRVYMSFIVEPVSEVGALSLSNGVTTGEDDQVLEV